MGKPVAPEDLSAEDLRRLLVEKRRESRRDRLERYRRTGRVVLVAPDIDGSSLEDMRSGKVDDSSADETTATSTNRKRILDGVLLFVEILAVVGLILLLFNGINMMRDLNDEVAVALEQPTLTPTPLIVSVVLPSGHTPPTSPEGARPNEAEIPQHLRPLVQSLSNIPIPTAGPEQASRIQIPAIGVDAPIVQGDGWEQLKKGVGQHIGTANPGDAGNLVLSAHNDIFGEIFRDLDRLRPGDEVTIYTNQRSYRYIVSESIVVEPTQVDVMESTTQPTLTLISCYPYLVDDQRIAITARLESNN
ncbi:MAG: class D sortase [Chloroflexota bacterium]|nr:MAG: class D sortase [Chloroflexota bacterium]